MTLSLIESWIYKFQIKFLTQKNRIAFILHCTLLYHFKKKKFTFHIAMMKKKKYKLDKQRRNNVNYVCLISVKAIGHCNVQQKKNYKLDC